MTAQVDQWRDELRRTGEVHLAPSRRMAAMWAFFFGLVILAGIYSWTQGEHVEDPLLVLFGAACTAIFARILITGNPRILVTPSGVQAFGASLAWTDVTWVEVRRAGGRGTRIVVLGCTDEAKAAIRKQLNPLVSLTHQLDRAVGLSQFTLPPVKADARELATWFNEPAAPSDRDQG